MVTSNTARSARKVIPSQNQLLVTSKTASPTLKVLTSPNQPLIKTKTSSPVLKVIPKLMMPSNTVVFGSPTPLKVTSPFLFKSLSSSNSSNLQNVQALPTRLPRVQGTSKYYIILPKNSVSEAVPSQTQMVTSKIAPRALKEVPSQNQLLIKTKASSSVLKVIPKIIIPSNTVASGSPTPLKVIPSKEIINHPTTLSNVDPNTQVVTKGKSASSTYFNPSQNQLLMTTKTSPPLLKVISKVLMPSNTVGSGSPTPLKVVPSKEIINHPTTLSNVDPNIQVVTKGKSASPTYVNTFDYTPYVKNTISSISRPKIVKNEQGLMQEIVNVAWACKICKKEFREKELLLEHYEMHKNITDQLGDIVENDDAYDISSTEVSCPICMTTYNNIAKYKRHVANKHQPIDHHCDTCKRTFQDDFNLSIHNAKHNQDPELYECVICKKFQTKDTRTLYEHIFKVHVKEEMDCDECGKAFLSKKWFEDHKIFHVIFNKRDTYKCSRCKSTFTSYYSLIEHVQVAHTKYKCNQCDVTFPYQENLDNHNRHLHSSGGRLLCNVCGKMCTKKSFKVHESTHKGVKYVCAVCGKQFRKKNCFVLHMRVHSGEKRYKCDLCDKAFTHSSGYNIHMRIHAGKPSYPCSECKKAFYTGPNLRRHMRVHTGERPYSCFICKKAFVQITHLKRHMITHDRRKNIVVQSG
uniref:Zinc finger protein 2-like n=1 Tax=Diabrotica virgifera virgifera TaxID=50390 RepID=A0A6P7F1L2_DIAVI